MFHKKYFQDRPILFLNLVVVLSALINIITVALRVDSSQSVTTIRYITALDIDGFRQGTATQLYGFALISVIIATVGIIISVRLYAQRRSLSLVVLSLTIIALLFNLIVSGAILNLQ